jgi:hypothetical protein
MSVVLANVSVGAATVFFGAVDVGATVGPVTITPEREVLLVQPEQLTGDVVAYNVKEGYVISFEHLEVTRLNLLNSWFNGNDGPAAPLLFGGLATPAVHTDFYVYGTAPGGFQRTVWFRRVVAVEPGDYTMSRREGHKAGAKYRALYDSTQAVGAAFGSITDATS